jgi:hypothetical protein
MTAGVWPLSVILLALGFTLATGPFRAPDEYHHFFRAYQISEGRLVAKQVGNEFLGDYLPRSLDKIARVSASYPDSPQVTTAGQHVSAARHIELKAEARDFLVFPGAALHAPFGLCAGGLRYCNWPVIPCRPDAPFLLCTLR